MSDSTSIRTSAILPFKAEVTPHTIFTTAIDMQRAPAKPIEPMFGDKRCWPQQLDALQSLKHLLEQRLEIAEGSQPTPHPSGLCTAQTGFTNIVRNFKALPTAGSESAKCEAFSVVTQNGVHHQRNLDEASLHIFLESQWYAAHGNEDSTKGDVITLAELPTHAGAWRALATLDEMVDAPDSAGFTELHQLASFFPRSPLESRPASHDGIESSLDAVRQTAQPKQQSGFNRDATRKAADKLAKNVYQRPLDPPLNGASREAGASAEPDNDADEVARRTGAAKSKARKVVSNKFAGTPTAQGMASIADFNQRLRQISCNTAWLRWMETNNIAAIENSGNGNNCLLLSLLQHATGRYDQASMPDLEAAARGLRKRMVAQNSFDINTNDHLLPDCDGVKWAVGEINRTLGRNLRLLVVQVASIRDNANGKTTVELLFNHDADQGTEPVAVLANGQHFMALVAT